MRTTDEKFFDEAFEVHQELDEARKVLDMAEIRRNDFIESAYMIGVPVVDLAEYFQLSRQMVYRIINRDR